MRFIGITGGVGAGKSAILAHLASKPGIRVMLADEIAHDLMQPGTECFQKLKEKFAYDESSFEYRKQVQKYKTFAVFQSEMFQQPVENFWFNRIRYVFVSPKISTFAASFEKR